MSKTSSAPRRTRRTRKPPGYDFTGGKRGAVNPQRGKTRITICIDTDILEAFRDVAQREGRGYQTTINEVLRAAISGGASVEERIRTVVREELAHLRAAT